MRTDSLIKGSFECVDGPFNGESIILTKSQVPTTAPFMCRGEVGRYVMKNDNKLYWESENANQCSS